MTEYYESLRNSPRTKRGWSLYSIELCPDLRWIEREGKLVLQQKAGVRWRHEKEQHIGGGYYSHEATTSEWIDVPTVKIEKEET